MASCFLHKMRKKHIIHPRHSCHFFLKIEYHHAIGGVKDESAYLLQKG